MPNTIRVWMLSFALLLVLCPFTNSHSGDFQSHSVIKESITGFITDQLSLAGKTDINIHVDRLDPRLKLTRCASKITPFLPSGMTLLGKVTLGVRCDQPKPWSVYVPVRVDIFENVLAASRPMLKGQAIGKHDIQLVRHKISTYQKPVFRHPAEITGMVIKRFVGKDKLFTVNHVAAPRLVSRGEEVILLSGTKTLTVRMIGKALADGSRGDLVQVRNKSSNRIIQGIVTSQGVVRVKM